MIKRLIEYYISCKRHRGKPRVVKLLLKLLPYKFIKSHYGVNLSANPKDKTNIYAISGDYGYVISNHIKSLPADSIFIDIGANYGLYSNLAAKYLTQGKILSFEPNPHIYQHHLLAIEKNKFKNIIPFHCAIAEQDGLLPLSYNEIHSGVSSLESKTEKNIVTVPAFNIATWEMLSFLNQTDKIHIKIDVEGYETSILKVLKNASWFQNIQSVVIEIDDKNLKSFGSSAENIYQILQENGLKPTIGLDAAKHYDEIFYR